MNEPLLRAGTGWRAEEALRESEQRFRTLFELGPVAVYTCDTSGVIREFNRRAAELWGRAPALGDTDERFCGSFKMIRPDGSVLAHEQCPMAEVLSGAIPHARDAEVRIERPDGSQVAVIVNIRPLKDEQGEITGAINCFYDITERKEMEQRLRQSEERYRMLADNISQFAWIADAKGWIYWYNQRWYDYTGTTLEEMEGWGWRKVHHPDHVERVVERVQQSWDTGLPWEDTFPLLGKNGEYRWFLSRALPIRDNQGTVLHWFGTNTDVTEQREMAEALRQNAADMADADRRKNEFLAMLSHELRNPLAPLANAVQLLRLQKDEDPVLQQARAIIERQASQLTHLVDDLLEISRITTGRIRLQLERVAMGGVVEHAAETVRPLIGSRRHVLSVSLPPEPIWLHADAIRLEQVVVNLLTNAAKYTDEGGHIWLAVELERDKETGRGGDKEREGGDSISLSPPLPLSPSPSHVLLRVRDTGVGIAPDVLPRVFELFTQAERSLDRAQGGLGIGLSLVQRLVQMHGGTVSVNSELGQGSEFVVRLPLLKDQVGRLKDESGRGNSGSSFIPPPSSLRVLVVDDNRDAGDILAMLLRKVGHEVRTAYEGATALELVPDYQPDVVLLDIGLPGISGLEVAQRIRQQPARQNILLIAMTGYGQESDRQRSLEAGFDHHLVKPADLHALQKILAGAAKRA